jgi:SAM-dependent methyltransferase
VIANDAVLAGRAGFARKVVARLVERLPERVRAPALLSLHRAAYRRFLVDRLANAVDDRVSAPVPPVELVAETFGMSEADAVSHARRENYLASAYHSGLRTLLAAEHGGVNLRTIGAILDFGCGAGKNLRVWREIHGVRLVGVDLNERQIAWAAAHVPGCEFHRTDAEPPLPFSDCSFDLVNAASVFTHIPLERQTAWLDELHRVLRPGGVLVATVAGRHHARIQLGERGFEDGAAVAIGPSDPRVSNASRVTGQLDVFQSRGEVIRAFGCGPLQLVDYLASAAGQDVLILHRDRSGRTTGVATQG